MDIPCSIVSFAINSVLDRLGIDISDHRKDTVRRFDDLQRELKFPDTLDKIWKGINLGLTDMRTANVTCRNPPARRVIGLCDM